MKTNLIGISGKIGSGKDTIGDIFNYLCQEEGWDSYYHFMAESAVNNDDYEIKKFAGKLKDIACLLLGCTREQLEDRDFKEKELGEEWWYFKYDDGEIVPFLGKHRKGTTNPVIKPTPRKLLQLLGTEAGREIIHPNIWVNALFADYKVTNNCSQHSDGLWYASEHGEAESEVTPVYPNWIITDVRFPNEAQAIKDRGGVVIRVNRPMGLMHEAKKGKFKFVCKSFQRFFSKFYQYFVTNEGLIPSKDNPDHPSETALDDYQFDHVIDNNGSIEELVEKVKQLNLI